MLRYLGSLILLASCARGPEVRPGDLDVVWRGAERGRFIAPLEAKHCAESGIVELLAIRGDSGFGAALFLKDSAIVEPTAYPVVPGSQIEEPRPGASAALRWFAGTSISAFEGVTGAVTLSLTGRVLSGTVDVKYQALDRPDTLRLTGTFSQVPVTMADSGCRLIQKRNRV
jgi:hypothetical protein